MKKFFTILIVLVAIFLFRAEIKDAGDKLSNYIQINILNKYENNQGDEGNNLDNMENNYSDSGIEDENNGNNSNVSNGSYINYENYKNIRLGQSVKDIKSKLGEPNKIEKSEYGFDWYVYNSDYSKFCMVGILQNKVVALFSNTMDSCESNIKLGTTESQVLKNYKPLEYRLKGNVRYIINEDYYSVIKTKTCYITAFYDSFDGNKVVGIQIISKKVEENMDGIYSTDSSICGDFENVNRYLINSERFNKNLNTLSYDENATLCARSHSKDMRDNDYFAHNNLKNQTPFDRMSSYNINYMAAAENIAGGQTSGIFAHYALMNSKGHRVNILGDYKYIGVGVVFGGSLSMYLTQNFYK